MFRKMKPAARYSKASSVERFSRWVEDLDELTILNLDGWKDRAADFNQQRYADFKTFYEGIKRQMDDEIEQRTGNVIDAFPFRPEFSDVLDGIKKKYNEMYLEPVERLYDADKEKRLRRLKNGALYFWKTTQCKDGKIRPYPFFIEDMHDKSDLVYQMYEHEMGFPLDTRGKPIRIEDQTDEQFFELFRKRLDGLKECHEKEQQQNAANTKEDASRRELELKYYKTAYEREKALYNDLVSNESMNYTEKVETYCKNLFMDYGNLDKYNAMDYDIDKIVDFLEKDNYKQAKLAKTFLPEECFDGYRIKRDTLNALLQSGDRNYRQYVFGFYNRDDRLKEQRSMAPFVYDVGGILEQLNYTGRCHQLVNFNIFMDLLYTRCAVSNRTPLAPFRFVLTPNYKTIIHKNPKTHNNTRTPTKAIKELQFDIRDKLPLTYLFDGNSREKTEFLGIITIKYFFESKDDDTHKFRIWVLFVFKNNNKKNNYDLLNLYSGITEEVFICNYRLRQINIPALFEKHTMTHHELLYIIKLSTEKKAFLYKPLGEFEDENIFFLSYRPDLEHTIKDLQMQKIDIKLDRPLEEYFKYIKTIVHITYPIEIMSRSQSNLLTGGSNADINHTVNIITIINERNLYFSKLILSRYYDEFNKIALQLDNMLYYSNTNKEHNYFSNKRKYFYKYLIINYPYLLINKEDAVAKFENIEILNDYKLAMIIKYMQLSFGYGYYTLNEIFIKYNLLDFIKNEDNILAISNNFAFAEYLNYKKYDFKNLHNILTVSGSVYNNEITKWKTHINTIPLVYNINNIVFNDKKSNIFSLEDNPSISKNNKLVFISSNRYIDGVGRYDIYYQIADNVNLLIFGLKTLQKGGIIIFNANNLAYKHSCDLILIIAQYFNEWKLFYPDINARFKKSGSYVLFIGFKGINENDNLYLETMRDKVNKIYPNEAYDFNIRDQHLREELFIYRPLSNGNISAKNIISFLDYDITDKIYMPFWEFNNSRHLENVLFMSKMIAFFNQPDFEKQLDIKLPTPDQITSSILYCRKYDIPFWDKYSTPKMESLIALNILAEMYGMTEPILYRFKTPFKTYIANKIILRPQLASRESVSILATVRTHTSRKTSRKSSSRLDRKTRKRLSHTASIGAFMMDIFRDSSKSKSSYSRKTSSRKSTLKRANMSLLEPLFPSNNQLVQVGRLIDSRRDFSKPAKKPTDKCDPQNEIYDELKYALRYYKDISGKRKIANLDIMVKERLGDTSISQAWLKMYEIITECELVPLSSNAKGTFRSFHLCELPGTFINALNNYILTKSHYTAFDWHAQSLHPRLADIKDTYNLLKRHRERWDFGADGTGDITNVANIRHYMKLAQQMGHIHLMTSDCGLPMGNPKYEFVAFASYVALLAILPRGGTMVYKILTPIDLPLIWNLIYITFTNFKELIFFKPVQNSQSREFYIVAKDYLGTEPKVINKLLDIIQRWSGLEAQDYKAPWVETTDLFGDTYPEEFVAQVLAISERLTQNYVSSIERIIYYVDNREQLGAEYKKHIEKYIHEKNEDWIRRYRPRKLENKWIL